MTPQIKRRLYLYLAGFTSVAAGLALLLYAFDDSLVFFYSPLELEATDIPHEKFIRVGGMVKENSVKRDDAALSLEFVITDFERDLVIKYHGLPPPMFRERQGVIAEGNQRDGYFEATRLLTKHDEKYMPPEIARSLKERHP